jgi:hypothetical protein
MASDRGESGAAGLDSDDLQMGGSSRTIAFAAQWICGSNPASPIAAHGGRQANLGRGANRISDRIERNTLQQSPSNAR